MPDNIFVSIRSGDTITLQAQDPNPNPQGDPGNRPRVQVELNMAPLVEKSKPVVEMFLTYMAGQLMAAKARANNDSSDDVKKDDNNSQNNNGRNNNGKNQAVRPGATLRRIKRYYNALLSTLATASQAQLISELL